MNINFGSQKPQIQENIQVFYQYQNGEDKTVNVYSLPNLWGEKIDIKVKHVLMYFPHSFLDQQYHFRFKIQCEKPQKQLAWLDIINMNAKAPLLNGQIHMKILELKPEQGSNIYNQEKLVNIQNLKEEEIQRLKTGKPSHSKSISQSQQKQQQNNNQNNEGQNQRDQELDQIQKAQKIEEELLEQRKREKQQQQQQQRQQQQFEGFDQQQDYNQQKQNDDDDEDRQHTSLFEFSPKNNPQKKSSDHIDSDDWGLGESGPGKNHNVLLKQIQFRAYETPSFTFQTKQDLFPGDEGNKPQKQQLTRQQMIDRDQAIIAEKVRIKGEEAAAILTKTNLDNQIRQQNSDSYKQIVNKWALKDKQRNNIRALLSSVHEILWENSGWQPLSIGDLLSDAQLKKAYHKALLKIHPDRNRGKGPEIEYLAENIINEIKLAWDAHREGN